MDSATAYNRDENPLAMSFDGCDITNLSVVPGGIKLIQPSGKVGSIQISITPKPDEIKNEKAPSVLISANRANCSKINYFTANDGSILPGGTIFLSVPMNTPAFEWCSKFVDAIYRILFDDQTFRTYYTQLVNTELRGKGKGNLNILALQREIIERKWSEEAFAYWRDNVGCSFIRVPTETDKGYEPSVPLSVSQPNKARNVPGTKFYSAAGGESLGPEICENNSCMALVDFGTSKVSVTLGHGIKVYTNLRSVTIQAINNSQAASQQRKIETARAKMSEAEIQTLRANLAGITGTVLDDEPVVCGTVEVTTTSSSSPTESAFEAISDVQDSEQEEEIAPPPSRKKRSHRA